MTNRTAPTHVLASALLATLACLPLAPRVAAAQDTAIAKTEVRSDAVVWHPLVEYRQIEVIISGPETRWNRFFASGDRPVLELAELADGREPAAGAYQFELRRTPDVDPEVRERLAKARETGDTKIVEELRRRGMMPKGPFVQSGSFVIVDGKAVSPEVPEKDDQPEAQSGTVSVEGDFEAEGAKRFRMVDPVDGSREILFTALEGPEAGTYYRGSARLAEGKAVIELPSHFANVTEGEGLTVQLTPVGGWARLYVVELTPSRLVVAEAGDSAEARFDFFVQGVRVGYAGARVERPVDGDR